MYIKKLQLLNFQVIESFEAEFDGTVYFVTGDNELGKSTLLKAIGALLTGQRDDVLRNGASKGFAKMIVGDDGEEYDVQLSFTEANPRGTLTIKQKSTGMATNNVSMLQRIFGYQDFDAVEFSRWSETAEGRRKQIAVVKSLLPESVRLRLDDIATEVIELKDERTGINRDVKTFTTLRDSAAAILEPGDKEKYNSPIDVSELVEKAKADAQLIEKAKTVRSMLAQRIQQLSEIPVRINELENACKANCAKADADVEAARIAYEKAKANAETVHRNWIEDRDKGIAALNQQKMDAERRMNNAKEWLAEYEKMNPEGSNAEELLAKAKEHNRRYESVRQYNERQAQLEQAKDRANHINEHIAELEAERKELIANAQLPVDGLSFTDDGLLLNGVPFMPGKVSDSQTMEIAAKLVIASNPTVKVFRIARGESLGAKRLETIIDIAKRNGFQGFIEQVQRGQNEMLVEEYNEA
ncbi:MAG: AAA family ATPase [Bacteroidales bacterium]|nr:AAA family ATPase [Bacteroidales bacterium]